ncbi:MAG TPA: SAM-dependent methyltransferase [Bryobacteraceae bacterium]|nr:SAM-dependent methyltransferase [Bryobacteraceae bacterium]
MSPLTEILRDEIRREGPISFQRFMDAALYHPDFGYYRRARDPFGKQGDYYTAEQIQPVFGILIAARMRALHQAMGAPPDFTVVELGAGRGEMRAAFSEWHYTPVDHAGGALPERFRGVVFANEFFDALPVEEVTCRDGAYREMRVAWNERFVWVAGPPVREEVADYLRRYFPPPAEDTIYEVNLEALAWLERIACALADGFVFTIDYGYTRAESVRFPRGTLMSYRRHRAEEDVLDNPGTRDITAHVAFTALAEHGARLGLETVCLETLAQTLLAAGEPDQFAAALAASTREEETQRRLRLKSLLFGMGETFRTLLQKAGGAHAEPATK